MEWGGDDLNVGEEVITVRENGFFSMGMGFSRLLTLNGVGNHSSGGMGLFSAGMGLSSGRIGMSPGGIGISSGGMGISSGGNWDHT